MRQVKEREAIYECSSTDHFEMTLAPMKGRKSDNQALSQSVFDIAVKVYYPT